MYRKKTHEASEMIKRTYQLVCRPHNSRTREPRPDITDIKQHYNTKERNIYSPAYEVSQVVLQKGQANSFS